MTTAIYIVTCVFVFVFGSVIGSFLNVVIYRTPLKQSIITEPSHCFSCGNRLKWYDMFPIFSWIILRGKCRFCGSKISPRYMIMEAVCAVSYLGAYLVYGFSWEFAVACVLFAVLIVPQRHRHRPLRNTLLVQHNCRRARHRIVLHSVGT